MQIQPPIIRTLGHSICQISVLFCVALLCITNHRCLKFFVFVRVSILIFHVCTCFYYCNYFEFRVCIESIDIHDTRYKKHENYVSTSQLYTVYNYCNYAFLTERPSYLLNAPRTYSYSVLVHTVLYSVNLQYCTNKLNNTAYF